MSFRSSSQTIRTPGVKSHPSQHSSRQKIIYPNRLIKLLDEMHVVKLTTGGEPGFGHLLNRQTPGRKGIWNNCVFKINEDVEECDFWVVYEEAARTETSKCPHNGTLFIAGESQSIRRYDPYFLDQFSRVLTCQPAIRHENKIFGQSSLPWFVGLVFQQEPPRCYASMDYDDLMNARPRKDRLLSALTSGKRRTAGQRMRLEFVRMMEKHFGTEFDSFTSDKQWMPDKWEAVSRYKYHLAIENAACTNYWTEKIADPFLGGCYPFYHGCPNLSDYFSSKSFTPIDINKPEKAIKLIERMMDSGLYEKSQAEIADSKERVLNRYNLFAVISTMVEAADLEERSTVTIEPERKRRWGVKERSRYRANQLLNWLDL